ncbi:MAG TPA: hypothetical protein VLG92_03985 [Candidatus Saccharimonadia bacterium]|nr:hypothetical protein [Candidatus Saccharimonadia bacterium]
MSLLSHEGHLPTDPIYERDRLLGTLDSISRLMISAAVELTGPAEELVGLTVLSGAVEPFEDAYGAEQGNEVELFFWTPLKNPLNRTWRMAELELPPSPKVRRYDFHPSALQFNLSEDTAKDDYKVRRILEVADFDFGRSEALQEARALTALMRFATWLN